MASLIVKRADFAGACYGVQRALDMVESASAAEKSVSTLGPLIHNPRVVESLRRQGVEVADSLDDIATEAIVIRSHGVVPDVIDALERLHIEVIDATCPHVMRAQRAAARLAKEGYHVLVVGEEGHPEVESISAHARGVGGVCTIVGDVADIPSDLADPVGIVVQTTQSHEKLDRIVAACRARGFEPLVKDTICFATTQRQVAAAELAGQVDVMIVIGGRNSSNTTRLYEICQHGCESVHHIETVEEIDPQWFAGCRIVGVSAGASTPEDQIESVIAYLEGLDCGD